MIIIEIILYQITKLNIFYLNLPDWHAKVEMNLRVGRLYNQV